MSVDGSGSTTPLVARVVPDVTGLDRAFDYLVPERLASRVVVGTRVRVPLHGRRVGGWVVGFGPAVVDRLVEIERVSSIGPSAEIIELAEWAARRWGTSRLRPFLVVGSPPTMVPAPTASVEHPDRRDARPSGAARRAVHRIGPLTDPLPIVVDAATAGPTLALHPSPAAGRALAARLRRRGFRVASLPDEWARAAAGVDVVVGSRAAVWAPCPDLRAVVVLDEHDESYQEQRTPTWHARDVAIERAIRVGASCDLVSPCPSATALRWAGDVGVLTDSVAQADWPSIEIDDRSAVEPWRRSLVGSRLVELIRDPARRVVCVLNAPGRARLLACRLCRALQRCETCAAAVVQPSEAVLECPRCASTRPVVCQRCASSSLAVVRPGVSRLREEIEAAAARPVLAVTGDGDVDDGAADVFVGTEAVLHRVRNVDAVVFLDMDAELLAPRYRASEQAVSLVVRAGRLVGPRERGGVVVVQTHQPDHEVLVALAAGDLRDLAADELERRRLLRLPPYAALALVEGACAAEVATATGLEWTPTGSGALIRADDWIDLGTRLAEAPRPAGRCRVVVDPPRV